MLRILLALAVLPLRSSSALAIAQSPHATSYSRVSRNGQLARSSPHASPAWADVQRPTWTSSNDTRVENESRSVKDTVSIAMSPVYVPPVRTAKLKRGEAIDHPTAFAPKYSTLDREMIAKLDAMAAKHRQIQQRFNAPANFAKGTQKGTASASQDIPSMNSPSFPGPLAPDVYEYNPPGFATDGDSMSKPIIGKYPSMSTGEKDSYAPLPSDDDTDYPSFDVTSYGNDGSTVKPAKYPSHYDDQQSSPPSFGEQDHQHDLIYDHVPEFYGDHHYYHHHHDHESTTEEPEMNDQRLDKRPYSYYFIGKKLWYVPLYFSIYFIIYIAALVLKSIARHKINFPAQLADVTIHHRRSAPDEGWWWGKMLEGAERFVEMSRKSS